jgi:hypothetical protein
VAPRAINVTNRQPAGGAAPATPTASAWRERQSGSAGDAAPPRAEPKFSELARKESPAPSSERSGPDRAIPGEEARPGAQTSARSRLLGARTTERPPQDLKLFRKPMAAPQGLHAAPAQNTSSSRMADNDYRGAQPHDFSDAHDEAHEPMQRATWDRDADERADYEQSSDLLEDGLQPLEGVDEAYDLDDEQRIGSRRPPVQRPLEPADHYREPRPPRSYRGIARLLALVVILGAIGAAVAWQWSNINSVYQFVSHLRSRQTQTAQQPAGEPKFGGRVPQEQTRQPPPAAAPQTQSGPAVAQRVVLYEEDPGNPQGKQYVGSAVWRTETVSPGSGLAPELQIRADVTIPDRKMAVTWSLRRNTDQALPASHTIEIMFNLPPDFAGGGVANVPGVLMKESEQARGVPLAGLAVKVTNGFFLIGLSAVDADVQRNLQLLKERPWFDIPIVYNNGGRAILALEKGPSGDRAFADAFAAWGK